MLYPAELRALICIPIIDAIAARDHAVNFLTPAE